MHSHKIQEEQVVVFMDDGSKVCMITHCIAKRLGLKEERMDQLMEVLGRAPEAITNSALKSCSTGPSINDMWTKGPNILNNL